METSGKKKTEGDDVADNSAKRSKTDSSQLEQVEGSTLRAWTKDLILAEPLDDIINRNGRFKIVHIYDDEFDKVDIMDSEKKDDEAFHLNESIQEVVEDDTMKVKAPPSLKEIFLAPKAVSGRYHRAAVLRISNDNRHVDLYFFDAGGLINGIRIDSLKPVTKEIMKYPILGYQVILQGVEPFNYLFTIADYERLMSQRKKCEFKVEVGESLERYGFFRFKNKVILSYLDGNKPIPLAPEINDLKKMEWEKFSCGKGTDDEICDKGKFGNPSRSTSNSVIAHCELKVGDEFSARVSRIVPNPKDPSLSTLYVVNINERIINNNFHCLFHQMQRYCEKIKPSNFYPALNEFHLFKLDDVDSNKAIAKLCGKWCRALRMDENRVYLVDFDDYIIFSKLDPKTYHMRRLYGEFMKFPVFTLKVHPKNEGKNVTLKNAEEIFKKGAKARYRFKVLKCYDDSSYDVEYREIYLSA